MKPIAAILLGLITFTVFMLPGLAMLWLVMLQGVAFNGGLVTLVIILFVVGCLVLDALIDEAN